MIDIDHGLERSQYRGRRTMHLHYATRHIAFDCTNTQSYPKASGISSSEMIGFFLFWGVHRSKYHTITNPHYAEPRYSPHHSFIYILATNTSRPTHHAIPNPITRFATACILFLSIPKWRLLIDLKLVAYFLSCIGMLAMALHTSGGVGDTLTRKCAVGGNEKAWWMVRFTLLAAVGCSTFASNSSDWQRNATRPKGGLNNDDSICECCLLS